MTALTRDPLETPMTDVTPGKWEALPPRRAGRHWHVGVPMVVAGGRHDGADGHYLVAAVHNGRPGDTLETEGANARLMAAAPDLLAACREALWACSGEEYDPDRFLKATELCRASIAKATGEPS